MKDYSPEVDNINPTTTPLTASQYHWCTSTIPAPTGYVPLSGATSTQFPDLAQLTLPYTCSGQDCCVNYLAGSVVGGVPTASTSIINGQIDLVGSTFASNPTLNPALDPSFGEGGTGSWLEADNQFCSATYQYNGATADLPDGTCEWTDNATSPGLPPSVSASSSVDALDDTMHTLSDFIVFANNFLGQNLDTLSSTFSAWYPQAAQWIAPAIGGSVPAAASNSACDDGSTCTNNLCTDGTPCNDSLANGRLLSIYDPYTGVDVFQSWIKAITTWLNNNNYASTSAWCVPPQSDPSMNASGSPTAENTYIATNGPTLDANITTYDSTYQPQWGDLGYVMACLNYNSGQNTSGGIGPIYNYTQCLNALPNGTCPATLPAACAASTLGRSLAGPAPVYSDCADYVVWVQNSLTLATDEAPKFALRVAFLNDVLSRALTMLNIFSLGDAALTKFLGPNGPAAGLINARSQTTSTATLPTSVIYGWQDSTFHGIPLGCTNPSGAPVGCSHIVKVTAYSPGRNCNSNNACVSSILSVLPWIKTTSGLIHRTFTLLDRDGYVYVSIKRWDQDHSSTIKFPNGHLLWQFLFHNPNGGTGTLGAGLPSACFNVYPNSNLPALGFGLEISTAAGLGTCSVSTSCPYISSKDQTAMEQAFMLNDNGNGQVDPINITGGSNPSSCSSGNNSNYCQCMAQANWLLQNGTESHACVQYVASVDPTRPSPLEDHDYSLRFVDCSSVFGGSLPPEDLNSTTGTGG